MKSKSLLGLLLAYLIIICTHFFYFPKWSFSRTEATLSWDVSGYYMYLPAIFIYKDLKKCDFHKEILAKYGPTPDFQQAYEHPSGNQVMKYSIGQAIQFAPSFFIAHAWASASPKYPADGFSFPYQFMISMNSLLMAFIGLYYLRRVLLYFFDDGVVALSVLAVVLGSNYLNYSAIDGAMTHNYLFTIYALLIFQTIHFYRNPNLFKAICIGLLIGIAALTRPTEIIACLIPILWGVNMFSKTAILERLNLLKSKLPLLASAVIACIAVGSIQLFYWKFVSGDWLVYSYEDQGFSWLKPHIKNGLISCKAGWLMYSPLMGFSLIGFYHLFKKNRNIFAACFIFSMLFMYITFAWDIWWYGGSLGQRALIQAYPILMFPFSSFLTWLKKQHLSIKTILGILMGIFCYFNLWFTHQAHKGGLLYVGQMTDAYYFKTLGRYKKNIEDLKLLDTNEYFNGKRNNVQTLYENDFSLLEEMQCQKEKKGVTNQVLCLDKENDYSPIFRFDANNDFEWVRASADFSIVQKEWNRWAMTQFIVRFYQDEKIVKEKCIRVQRLMNHGDDKNLFIDVKKSKKSFDQIGILFWNPSSEKQIMIDNLRVEKFDKAK